MAQEPDMGNPYRSLTLQDADARIDTHRRAHNIRYRVMSSIIIAISLIAAATAARFWPITGGRIQASFFSSLASSLLTVFGLVFTLCLIGSQLTPSRASLMIRRVFGLSTFCYLAVFILTTFWTLAISYRAGETDRATTLCSIIFHRRVCISEASAGRLSIFGLSWSILLLVPFISYVYRRLTPRYAFSSIVSSALRARTGESFRRRVETLSREIIAVSSEAGEATQGLHYFIELGIVALRRGRVFRPPSNAGVVQAITSEMKNLNAHFSYDQVMSIQMIKTLGIWSSVIIHGDGDWPEVTAGPVTLTRKQLNEFADTIANEAGRYLRVWQISTTMTTQAAESVRLLKTLAGQCRDANLKVSFSRVARQMATCAEQKVTQIPGSDYNLALRGLISLADIACTEPDTHLR